MELAVLQTFVAAVKQGSFAAVARERNVDPSSISRAIANLEKELGIRLLQRTTRQLSLTEAGSAYFQRIDPLVEEIQQAANVALDISGQPVGTLRITASVSFGLKCIVPLLPSFKAHYPGLTVDLFLTDTNVDLLTERVDLAIRLGLLADSTLIAQRLIPTHYCVCASPQYLDRQGIPTRPEEIANHNCLLFPLAGFRSKWRFRDPQQRECEVLVQGDVVISNAIALQQCAIAGLGLALLPNWLIGEDLRARRLVNVFPHYEVTATDFRTAAWWVYPSRAYIPRKVHVFMDFVKQSIVI
ncbi:MAG: LysR family transcriptional regulator [Cyanobacteria bacterium P01_H01_bin.15]